MDVATAADSEIIETITEFRNRGTRFITTRMGTRSAREILQDTQTSKAAQLSALGIIISELLPNAATFAGSGSASLGFALRAVVGNFFQFVQMARSSGVVASNVCPVCRNARDSLFHCLFVCEGLQAERATAFGTGNALLGGVKKEFGKVSERVWSGEIAELKSDSREKDMFVALVCGAQVRRPGGATRPSGFSEGHLKRGENKRTGRRMARLVRVLQFASLCVFKRLRGAAEIMADEALRSEIRSRGVAEAGTEPSLAEFLVSVADGEEPELN